MERTISRSVLHCFLVGVAACASYDTAIAQCGVEGQRLTSPAPSAVDAFGVSIAIDGDRVAVGASGDAENGEGAGAAHLFRLNVGQWEYETKLLPTSASEADDFGRCVAIDGVVVVVGGPNDDVFGGMPAGSAVVFRRRSSDQQWSQETTLTADDPAAGSFFGQSVAIDGDVVVVGTPGEHTSATLSGAAYIYRYNSSGLQWAQEVKLSPADPGPFKFFGDALAISGDTVAVGAWGDGDRGDGAGAVYVYRRANDVWSLEQKLYASDASEGANFGKRVALDGGLLLATAENADLGGIATGAVYAFRRAADGTWAQEARLVPGEPLPAEAFAVSVAVSGRLALIGGSYQDPNQQDPNNPVEQRWAYAFRNDAAQWVEVGTRLAPASPRPGEIFGYNLALQGGTAAIGSFHRTSDGSAYIFDLNDCLECPGDLDGDRDVDLNDLTRLLSSFGSMGGQPPGDLDGDGDVDLSDLTVLLSHFGSVCN